MNFFSDQNRLIRLATSFFCALAIVALSFTMFQPQSEPFPFLCSAKCSTYCSGGKEHCFEISCCHTNSGGCKVGDPSIFTVKCTDHWGGGGGGDSDTIHPE